jgi:hypothetical protein
MNKMRRPIVLAILMLIWFAESIAQAPDTLWTRWYGGSEYDGTKNICETSDGGFISCGHSNSFTKIYQTWLVKMNSDGDTVWTKILGDSERPEDINSLEETNDGGFIACGSYFGIDIKDHTYLIKLDYKGDIEWKKVIGITNNSADGIKALQTNDNGYIVLAQQRGSGAGFWLYKTDSTGEISDSTSHDWKYSDNPEDIALSDDGGYVIAGISNSFGTSTAWDDMFLFKFNSNLDSVWMKFYADNDSLGSRLSSVKKTSDGGYLLVGAQEQYPDAINRHDFFVVKTDENGNEEWKKLYGGPKHDVGFNSLELPDKGFILIGNGISSKGPGGFDAYVIRINSKGDTLWTGFYGTPGFDELTQIKPVKTGGFILAGNTYYYSSNPNKTDIYFIRLGNDKTGTNDYFNSNNPVSVSPNPFSKSTAINYELQTPDRVRIDIFNSLGKKISTLVDKWQEAGKYNYELLITNYELSSGLFYFRIQIGNSITSGKLILLK